MNEAGISNEEIIQETEDKVSIFYKFSELINIINKKYNGGMEAKELDYENFGKLYSIPKVICKNIKVADFTFYKEIFYKEEWVFPSPLEIAFVNLERKEYNYRIYTEKYVSDIIKKLNFKNPVIIQNKNEFPFSCLKDKILRLEKFKIEEKDIIDYEKDIFQKGKTESNKLSIKSGSDLTENFKYYFKYPNPYEEFLFISSEIRSKIFFSNKFVKKIVGICGPMGIGKSTTLLALSKIQKNYCYLNIKALKEEENNILIWRDKLLLLEIAYAMKNNYKFKYFKELEEKIKEAFTFWEAIIISIKYFIEQNITICFIFDQYQEKIDSQYKYIKSISKILEEEDEKNNISIIISSSINDKDVRESLLFQWLHKKNNHIFDYDYYGLIINIEEIIKKDNSLTETQKKMILNDFNSIPKFYYAIKTIKDENKLIEYKNLQIKKIRKSINDFFNDPNNDLSYTKIEILLNFRPAFGKYMKKEDFEKIIEILPFKYFMFNIQKYKIDFSFPLVKDIFDDYLSKKICDFLKGPASLKDGTLGDILELNLINDLRDNSFCNFTEIIEVDSIWDLKTIHKYPSFDNNDSILILQKKNEAKYIDFGILYQKENLLLYQCKKALKKLPENPITMNIIQDEKFYLENKFKNRLNISLKKVFLFYITGITFFKKDNKIDFRTWGVTENENFENIEKVARAAKSELFYYDVINKKIYYKNDLSFIPIDNLIEHAIKFSNYINITENERIDKEKQTKIDLLKSEKFNDIEKRLDKIKYDIDKLEFFTMGQKSYLKKNFNIIYQNKPLGYISNPEPQDLEYKRMIGLKRYNSNNKYLIIEKIKEKTKTEKPNVKKNKKTKKKKQKSEEEAQERDEEIPEKILEEKKDNPINENKIYSEEENKDIDIENQNIKTLFLVKDNELKEVNQIEKDFYQKIEYALIFENNVTL